MIFSYIKNLLHCKKECREETRNKFDEILEDSMGYNGENMYEPQDNNMKIYLDMKEMMGLNDVKIDYKLDLSGPAAVMFREVEEGKYELWITVYMPCDSEINWYKASLAHELWHVKTSLELIREIGIDEFVKLTRDYDFEKSLAFKTMSEYYSWYKATLEYNEKKSTFRLKDRLDDYKDERINKIELCDTIAAHCAWNVVHNVVSEENKLSEEEKLFVKRIMQIIIENTENWPLPLEHFKNMGEDMSKAFMII